jgi:hypothetical protein
MRLSTSHAVVRQPYNSRLINGYFVESDENSVHKEPSYVGRFNADLNAFLKWNQLGRSLEETPKLQMKLTSRSSSWHYQDPPA